MIASSVVQIVLLLRFAVAAAHSHESPTRNDLQQIIGGCGKPLPENQVLNSVNDMAIAVTHGATPRKFKLFVPPLYDQQDASPLILSFHGGYKTAQEQLELDQLTSPYFNNNSIVVYPQGRGELWQGVPGVTTNDILFTKKLIARIKSLYCVDPNRIFATGKSDGAGFVGVLACDSDLSKEIAAFAPVSGAFYCKNGSETCDSTTVPIICNPGRVKVPFLEFHGGNDKTINYTGGARKGECLPAIPYYMQQWVARDSLVGEFTSKLEPDTTVHQWGEGDEFGLVTHVFDATIGHDWPSTVPNDDNQHPGHIIASFNATPIILDFFFNHTLVPNLDAKKEL